MSRHRRGPEGLQVFAVEDRSVQLVWTHLEPGPVSFTVGPAATTTDAIGGPGAVVLDGLEPATAYFVEVARPDRRPGVGSDDHLVDVDGPLAVVTLPAPPGLERCRVATISDLHLGASHVGFPPIREHPAPAEAHAVACARAAIAEALAWGAQLLVVKGDVTDHGTASEWELLADLIDGIDVPVVVLPGNHDRRRDRTAEPAAAALGSSARVVDGAAVDGGVAVHDLPGLRVVAADTSVDGRHHGRTAPVHDAVVAAAGGTTDPVVVMLHHQLQRRPWPPLWPPGVPPAEGGRLLDALAEVNPRTLVTSGHTHRHRRRVHGPITVTEVGSTHDYPGTWAGYVAHDGGLRQVVRRIVAPDAIAWTERTRHVLFGLWGRWSPGRLQDRCFTLRW